MIAKEQPEWKNTLQMAEKTPWNIPFPAPQLLPEVGIKAERDKSGAGAQVVHLQGGARPAPKEIHCTENLEDSFFSLREADFLLKVGDGGGK